MGIKFAKKIMFDEHLLLKTLNIISIFGIFVSAAEIYTLKQQLADIATKIENLKTQISTLSNTPNVITSSSAIDPVLPSQTILTTSQILTYSTYVIIGVVLCVLIIQGANYFGASSTSSNSVSNIVNSSNSEVNTSNSNLNNINTAQFLTVDDDGNILKYIHKKNWDGVETVNILFRPNSQPNSQNDFIPITDVIFKDTSVPTRTYSDHIYPDIAKLSESFVNESVDSTGNPFLLNSFQEISKRALSLIQKVNSVPYDPTKTVPELLAQSGIFF